MTVVVTAEDGSNASYTFTVVVARSSEVGVSSISVNATDVTVSRVYTALVGSTSVDVSAVTVDADATYVVLGASALQSGSNNVTVRVTAADGVATADYVVVVSTVTVVVTAEDGSNASYTFTVVVARSSEVGVSSISVGGSVVAVGGSVVVPFGTASVEVTAVPVDFDASISVLGASALQSGSNNVTVRVTAADGVSTADYVVYVSVTAASTDTGLSVFTIGGVNVLDGSIVQVSSDVSSVLVNAQTSSDLASFAVSGNSDLVVGENVVSVTVTAQDSSKKVYYAKVVKARPISSDVSLASLTVNDSPVAVDGVFDVVYGTSSVSVVAVASDVNASTQVFGVSGLVVGLNTVSVLVTAEDQSSKFYEFKVRVARSNNTSLLSVSVDGVALTLTDLAVTVGPAVSSVDVSAVAFDIDANATVSGNSALSFGLNTVTVQVTAADGIASRVYQIAVTRTPYSSDKRLASLRVNGVVTAVDSVVSVEPGVTSVTVSASAVDADASVDVLGDTDLDSGNNTVTVRVTAADSSVASYTFTVFVRPVSTDTSLKLFTVNGIAVVDGGLVSLDGANDFVTVVAQATDVNAQSVVVSGSTGLQFGLNTVSVSVTSESGSVRVHQVDVFYPDVTDATLKTFTVDNETVADGDSVDLAEGTTEVAVVAQATYGGQVDIEGGTDLQPGENSLVVTVTSLDGLITAEYTVTLNVALSSDTGLASFTVNATEVTGNSVLNLDPYTSEVEVIVEPVNAGATFEIEGREGLQAGSNTLLVTVTAANGEATRIYTVTLNVLLGDDVELAKFQINGEDVSSGDTVTLAHGSESAEITAEPVRASTTAVVTGADALTTGRNIVKVLVTAEDSNYRLYRLIVIVAENNDTSLESFTIGGQDAVDGGTVTLPAGTRAAVVSAVTTDPLASVAVEGGTGLEAGENTVTVTVTAADGETTEDYVVTVFVESVVLSDDVRVNSITVAGQNGLAGNVRVSVGTRAVLVLVETTNPFASFTVDGNTDLQPGETDVIVTVTAADGETTQEYVVKVVIPELSDDTSTSLLAVNGLEVADGESIDLASGTSHVSVKVVTTDPLANFVVSGDGTKVGSPLREGENSLVVTVFAQNGDSTENTITLNVLTLSKNTDLAEEGALTVNGSLVDIELLNQPTGYLDLPINATRISVGVKAADPGADVFVNDKTVWPTIARQFSVEKGVNLISIEVVPPAGQSFAKTYVLKVYVGGADATLKSAKVNNTALTFNSEKAAVLPGELANGTTSVNIFAEPTVALSSGNTPGTKIEFDPP
ncbi:MAG: hypothetical protein EBZ87_01845, partial [Microbacteriaceae bacterium]|nr:hypothetical protein [Microbacteriaceae bacterium]